MFSCEICEIFKNAYVKEYLLTTASDSQTLKLANSVTGLFTNNLH